jgi:hypothetical protein
MKELVAPRRRSIEIIHGSTSFARAASLLPKSLSDYRTGATPWLGISSSSPRRARGTYAPTGWFMNSFNLCHAAIRRSSALVAGCLLLLIFAVPIRSAYAAPDAVAPVEDFSRELDKLKKSFGDLGKKIDDSTKTIDGLSDVDKAKKEIEDLRAAVGSLLDLVADNGALDKLGDKALSRARDKLKELEQDNRFKPEDKNFLIEQWRRLRDDTERATEELGSARKRFAELLRTLQANEDFIDELVQIRQAQRAIDVIRQLTREIRGASDQLHRLIAGIKPPGA